MPLEFVTSQMGKSHLVHDGHEFVKENVKLGKTYWKCTQYKVDGCKSRVHTYEGEIVHYQSIHSHGPRRIQIEIKRAVNNMKGLAKETMEPPKRILAAAVREVDPALIGALPAEAAISKTINRAGREANYPQGIPRDITELVIPPNYRVTDRGEEFLRYDSGPDDDRILLFTTASNLRSLRKAKYIFGDGTFKTAPKPLFNQLYTVHADLKGRVAPMVFALVRDKEETTYVRMLNAIKRICPNLRPDTSSTDFEPASINAFEQAFPPPNPNQPNVHGTKHKGCWFHFSQCIWRKVQNHGDILRRYKADAAFAVWVKCLGALSFVPPAEVTAAYEELRQSDFYRQNRCLHPLLEYFEQTWLGVMDHWTGVRGEPLFPIELWNNRESVFNKEHLTTNSLEGWHRAFNGRVGATHPNIWQCINHLKMEQNLVDVKVEAFLAGRKIKPKPEYVQCYERIHNAAGNWGQVDTIDFLRGISHNLEFNVV